MKQIIILKNYKSRLYIYVTSVDWTKLPLSILITNGQIENKLYGHKVKDSIPLTMLIPSSVNALIHIKIYLHSSVALRFIKCFILKFLLFLLTMPYEVLVLDPSRNELNLESFY